MIYGDCMKTRITKTKILTIIGCLLLSLVLVFAIQTIHVIPVQNATYDLGNSSYMYRDLWISREGHVTSLIVKNITFVDDNACIYWNGTDLITEVPCT